MSIHEQWERDIQGAANSPGGFGFTYVNSDSPDGRQTRQWSTSHSNSPANNGSQATSPVQLIVGTFAQMLGNILGARPSNGEQWQSTGSPFSQQLSPGNRRDYVRSPLSTDDTSEGSRRGSTTTNRPRSVPGDMPSSFTRTGGVPGFTWRVTTTRSPFLRVPDQRDSITSGSTERGHNDNNQSSQNNSPMPGLPPLFQMMFGSGNTTPSGTTPLGERPSRGGSNVSDDFPFPHGGGGIFFFPQGGESGQQADNPFARLGPLGPIFASLFNPAMMQGGDAVYSQEALDQIISQLMEQHTSGNAPGPATQDAIAHLPKHVIDEKDLGEEGTAECSICIEAVKLGEEVTELPCHHWFHGECIKAWLSEHDTCPQCRQGIMAKDAPPDSARPRQSSEAPRHDQMWGQNGPTSGDGTANNPWTVPDTPAAGPAPMHPFSAHPSRRNRDASTTMPRRNSSFEARHAQYNNSNNNSNDMNDRRRASQAAGAAAEARRLQQSQSSNDNNREPRSPGLLSTVRSVFSRSRAGSTSYRRHEGS